MKLGVCLLFYSSIAMAQTAESAFFRVILLPANEVPAINNGARGIADVVTSVVRDSGGQIVSGNIDVLVRTTLPAAATGTGLNLHNGIAGQNVPPALSTGLSAASARALQTGADSIHLPIPVTGDNPAALASLRALFLDPTKFYLNLTTTDQPNGLMRGQLAKTQVVVLLALLSSDNVTPAANSFATGFGEVVAIGTRDANGNLTSAEVYLWATSSTTDPSAINGFHIHVGPAGSAGAIAITAAIPPGAAPDPSGAAQLGPLYTEITTTNATQAGAFTNLFVNPTSLYLDLHTVQNPNGLLRGQLRSTGSTTFPLLLDSANETAPPAVRVMAPANITMYALRSEDGSIAAAALLTDLNLRFPTAQQFIGLYVHDAAAGNDGPISIKAAPDFASDTGFGNYYGWTAPLLNLGALNDLAQNPESHYANLHSVDQPGGVVRAQFASAVPRAAIAAVIPADLDKAASAIAPGELISIFGSNLAKLTADLGGWSGRQLPVALDGAGVTIGGIRAPLVYVSPTQINAQAPVELGSGVQTVVVDNGVDNGAGPSAALSVNVVAMAPAIFFAPVAAVLKNANFSLVSVSNPARAGDVLLVFATGLGQTTPSIPTGALTANDTLARTATVTATIGGKPATVVYSIASPGFAGLYQVAVTVPAGLTGTVNLQISAGGVASNQASNQVAIPVQ